MKEQTKAPEHMETFIQNNNILDKYAPIPIMTGIVSSIQSLVIVSGVGRGRLPILNCDAEPVAAIYLIRLETKKPRLESNYS